jgi:hypothetical protein
VLKPKQPLQRTDLMDTSLEAHQRLIEGLRKMSPEEKIRITFDYMDDMKRLKEAFGDSGLPRNRVDV